MVQLLHRRMSDAGIDVLMEARLVDIYARDDRVVGVAIERADGAVEKIGCDALILACGGFGANRAMTDRYMPETATLKYNGHEGSQGEAIVVAERLGAKLADMGSYQGYAMLTEPQGISVPPPVLIEGGIIVNKLGDRFTDESADIAGMVHPLAGQPNGLGWVIYDTRIEQSCADIPELAQLMALSAPKKADDLDTLAILTGADPAKLSAAIDDVRRVSEARGVDHFGRSWSSDRPPSGPYRALKVTGALYHTQGGLQIDGSARVLREDGIVFSNLFAGGGSARSVSGPSSWGYLPAMGLTTAVVLGRLAGMKAAKVSMS
jgi:fumarate reductase flavoprotein subunit